MERKKELHTHSMSLCASKSWPPQASVTSVSVSDEHRSCMMEKNELWWSFHFRRNSSPLMVAAVSEEVARDLVLVVAPPPPREWRLLGLPFTAAWIRAVAPLGRVEKEDRKEGGRVGLAERSFVPPPPPELP